MATPRNIAQAEFFHVGKDASRESLEDVMDEMAERLAEGAPLKTVVRFYDEDNSLTRFTQDASALNVKKEEAYKISWDAFKNPLTKLVLSARYRRVARKVRESRSESLELARAKLTTAVKARRPVAIECDDHSFRLADNNELHELINSAQFATGVWLFMFEPNNLLADKNEIVASFM
jgi:hypothetical protein